MIRSLEGTSREEFERMADDIGFTPSEIRHLSEDTRNQIPFPPGEAHGVRVAPSEIEGHGLFATKYFAKDDSICPAAIAEMRTPAGRFINHSDNPNAKFQCEPTGRVTAYALQPICSGDEITVDYRESMEAAIAAHYILKGVH